LPNIPEFHTIPAVIHDVRAICGKAVSHALFVLERCAAECCVQLTWRMFWTKRIEIIAWRLADLVLAMRLWMFAVLVADIRATSAA